MRVTPILSLMLAAALAAPVAAQAAGSTTENAGSTTGTSGTMTMDAASLTAINDTDVVGPDGARIGEVEDVLIDQSGAPVAVAVEISDGFLDFDDDEVIFSMDELTFEGGQYTTTMAKGQIKSLPRHQD